MNDRDLFWMCLFCDMMLPTIPTALNHCNSISHFLEVRLDGNRHADITLTRSEPAPVPSDQF